MAHLNISISNRAFVSSILLLESPNIAVLKVQLGSNVEETNDRFEIDIFMWAISTQGPKQSKPIGWIYTITHFWVSGTVSDTLGHIPGTLCPCFCTLHLLVWQIEAQNGPDLKVGYNRSFFAGHW